MTISNGDAEGGSDGGGIRSTGSLTVEQSTVTGNVAAGAAKGYTVLGAAALSATRDPNYRNNIALHVLKIG